MQKIKSLVVLCCMVVLILPATMPFILQLRIFFAREEAMERLEHENLQVVRLTDNQVQWAEEGEELLVGGRLFDVRELRRMAGSIEVTGIFDEQETVLQQKIDDFWKDQQSKNGLLLIKFYNVLGSSCFRKPEWSCQQPATVLTAWSWYCQHQLRDIYIRIPYPPPQEIS